MVGMQPHRGSQSHSLRHIVATIVQLLHFLWGMSSCRTDGILSYVLSAVPLVVLTLSAGGAWLWAWSSNAAQTPNITGLAMPDASGLPRCESMAPQPQQNQVLES